MKLFLERLLEAVWRRLGRFLGCLRALLGGLPVLGPKMEARIESKLVQTVVNFLVMLWTIFGTWMTKSVQTGAETWDEFLEPACAGSGGPAIAKTKK